MKRYLPFVIVVVVALATFGSGAMNVSMNWTNAPLMNFPAILGLLVRSSFGAYADLMS